ncbi:hypothetical protein ACIBCT_37125 [Streptosporangium sp. NPDC050855]|uniref:hypothetical protein n=1 Tax=Streptosporangium sp. NPDC050855 TaxID=3366194 RepID=UPI0037A5D901
MLRKLIATTTSLLVGAALLAGPAAADDLGAPALEPNPAADLGAAAFDPNPTMAGNGKAVPAPHYATGARGLSAPGYLPGCRSGRVCVAVLDYQDSRINTWKIWDLYLCGDYSLYDWHGRGWIRNNQTGGAITYRMNSNWQVVLPNHPVDNRWLDVDWEPAWHLTSC